MTYISAALRRQVHERAGGACEYCLLPETASLFVHEVDHVVGQKHGGATTVDNLALACAACNLRKGSDIASIDPATNEIVPLFHPRKERWSDTFHLADAEIVGQSPAGRATAAILQLNRPDRVAERAVLIAAGALKVPG
ncbi:MAG: HNH endonuclease signature motif containing protein [Byssovorax sp.]